MLITTARHERIVAAKDAEIANLQHDVRQSQIAANSLADENASLRASAARTLPLPDKAKLVLECMHADCGFAAHYIASLVNAPEVEVKAIIRSFEAYGWAFRHAFHSEDDNLIRGSGYFLTNEGWAARQAMLGAAA